MARRGACLLFRRGSPAGVAVPRRDYPLNDFAGRSADMAPAELAEDHFASRLAQGATQPRAQQIGVGERVAVVASRRPRRPARLPSRVAGGARAAADAFFS